MVFGFARTAFRWWSNRMVTHPYSTQILTNGPLWCGGDLIAQKLIEDNEKVDLNRLGRMTIYGYVVAGPVYCWWYRYIETLASPLLKRGMTAYLLGKVALDQFVFEPPYLLLYFTATSLLEGKTIPEIKGKLKEEYGRTFLIDCTVWPVAQLLNFRFVPLHLQALVVNSISLGWAGFLSFVTHKKLLHSPDDDGAQR